MKLLPWLVIVLLLASNAQRTHLGTTKIKEYGFRVVHAYPHDPTAFTQGLEFRGGYLYEGTGLHGRSTVRKVKLETGQTLQEVQLAPEYFGEGITIANERLLELTWQAQIGFVYDQASFRRLRSFDYSAKAGDSQTMGARFI